uniref:Nbr1 FW domain-containing protein n=1 Tax=Xenopsylla cheopis TaxID=163159 RepID=A0A6M2DIG0_XENCH
MDFDNGPLDQNLQNTSDLEQSLLQQFSCLGTTDHDELVSQLQKILGNNLNETTARFFLDMSNWNLQAAIGSYLDCETPAKVPSMILLADVTVGEGESITPNTSFIKTWRIQNNGVDAWPQDCVLQMIGTTTQMDCLRRYSTPALIPGQIWHISIEMVSPSEPGVHQSKWRMMTRGGSYFGDTIWAIITVAEGGTMALTQKLAQLSTQQQNQDNSSMNVEMNDMNALDTTNLTQSHGVPIPMPNQSTTDSTIETSSVVPYSYSTNDDSNMC